MNHKIKLTTPEEICEKANSINSELKHNEPKRFQFFYVWNEKIKAFFMQFRF